MDDLEAQFWELKRQWKSDTDYLSSVTKIVEHPSYRQIIEMASTDPYTRTKVLELIFVDLREAPEHWFHALQEITRQTPIKHEDAGHMDKMRLAWLNWARQHGYHI